MPRLPTIRVIGSQATSTRPSAFSVSLLGLAMVVVIGRLPPCRTELGCLPGAGRARGELGTSLTPLGFLIDRVGGHRTEATQRRTPGADHGGRQLAPRRLVHEGHEFVGEARHSAANADAANIGAAPHAVHPAALGHIALDDWTPAAELDDALRRAVLGGEVSLLVVARPVAALVHRGAEQPGGPQGIVE